MSMNDPDWGRNSSGKGSKDENSEEERESNIRPINSNNQNGPPDLDELCRDFNKRVNNMFGNNKGGGPGGNGGGQRHSEYSHLYHSRRLRFRRLRVQPGSGPRQARARRRWSQGPGGLFPSGGQAAKQTRRHDPDRRLRLFGARK